MAKVRAYKLAEELGLEKDEFLTKAREIGVELRSAMVGVEDDDAELLRRRLGAATAETHTESRVDGKIIRRRRKKEAPVEPEAPSAEPTVEPAAAEPVAAGPAAPEPVAAEITPAPAVAAEVASELQESPAVAAEPAGEAVDVEAPTAPSLEPTPAPLAASATSAATSPPVGRDGRLADGDAPGRRVDAPRAPARRPAKREANQAANLKEQDTLARSVLGNVQRRIEQRRMIVEQQSRMSSRRGGGRRSVTASRRLSSPTAPRKRMQLRLGDEISLSDLSGEVGVKVRDLLRQARGLGVEVDRDSTLDFDTASLLAGELGFEVERARRDVEEAVIRAVAEVDAEAESRPPVVTVMGHVDHGKTSLLDTIRNTKVTEGEAGGITQHIGAYTVEARGQQLTFLDTPGHAAFTAMRARGAQATDIVILVVAADDGVMPQTVEAINHARAADVPMIVAVNKVDRAEADPQRVKSALLEHEVVLEDFGGDVIGVEVSATQGTNIDKLLEMIALQAEVLELRARRKGAAQGVVIEARLDKGRGPVATLLIQQGTLKRGDAFVVGSVYGRVRSLIDEDGHNLKQALPSTPVQIVGLAGVPEAGDEFSVVKNEREAKAIAEKRQQDSRRAEEAPPEPVLSAEDLFASVGESGGRELRLIVKADVHGSMEAVRESIEKLSTDRVAVQVLHCGVGAISENDVTLASASQALVVGFHVRPDAAARRAAEAQGVQIRTFDIVYELLDDVTALMRGLLPPKRTERVLGHAEVRELFVIPKLGTIAGCMVADGTMRRSDQVRVMRDGVPIYTAAMKSLRRFKDDVREVQSGLECGILVENFNDVKVGDVLETFDVQETVDTL